MLGQLYLSQKQLDPALAEFRDLARRDPKSVSAHTMVGMILQVQSKPAEAQKSYQRALEVNPHAVIAANNLAWLYADQGGNLDVALQLAQTAKSRLPDQPDFNDTLGWVYLQKDLPSLAIPPLRIAVDKAPKDPNYQYHLGLAYAKAGDSTRARQALEAALKLDANFGSAQEAKRVLASLR
jgi:Flp pilus assembly protein TadD